MIYCRHETWIHVVEFGPPSRQDVLLRAIWDRFVTQHERAAFSYLTGHLRALAETTSYTPVGLMLSRDGMVKAVLPWIVTGHFQRRAVSLPFYEMGGPLFAPDATVEQAGDLFWQAQQAVAAQGVRKPLELRLAGGWHRPDLDLPRTRLYDWATLRLDRDPEVVLSRCDRQVGKALRKAAREAVTVHRNNSAAAVVRDFYPAYLRWMRDRHRTPPLSEAYWRACHRNLEGVWQLFQAWHGGRLIGQLLGFAVGRRVAITTIISETGDWGLRANDRLHWAFIEWACRHGYEWFDLGAVRYDGQRRYKAKWGCEFGTYERALLGRAGEVAELPQPEGPLMELVQRAWGRLPLSWTATLGPEVRAWLTL